MRCARALSRLRSASTASNRWQRIGEWISIAPYLTLFETCDQSAWGVLGNPAKSLKPSRIWHRLLAHTSLELFFAAMAGARLGHSNPDFILPERKLATCDSKTAGCRTHPDLSDSRAGAGANVL